MLGDLVVEGASAAKEIVTRNPEGWRALRARLESLPVIDLIDHEASLKARLLQTRLIIRIGEASPYANVILRC